MTPSLQDVMDACGNAVFCCFTVKEAVLAAEYCTDWRKYSQEEIEDRADKWLAETSRAWAWLDLKKKPHLQFDVSADELPDNRDALDCLEKVWQNQFDSPSHLLKTIAADWCGGWPRFLHARETSAKPQPRIERGRHVEFTTLGTEDVTTVPIALIFDIHCDGRSEWCGVHPIDSVEVTSIPGDDDDDSDAERPLTVVYPMSTKTLGDATDASTIHPLISENKPSKYLLSTDANDTRKWNFNVSVVTPRSSETLIFSISNIAPKEVIKYISKMKSWEKDSGYSDVERWKDELEAEIREDVIDTDDKDDIEHYRMRLDSFLPDKRLLRCSELDPVTRLGVESEDAVLKGLDGDGHMTTFSLVEAQACYWLDKRNPEKKRLHLTLDYFFEDALWGGMFLNPRIKKSDGYSAPEAGNQSGRPAKRRRY